MEQWIGATAIVTGASSGMGAAIAKKFVESGINVVGLSRRLELLEELSQKTSTKNVNLYPIKCDVTDEQQILSVFDWIENTLGGVSILVNNAGIYNGSTTIDDGDIEIWKQTISTNCIGLSIFTREAIKSMKAHNIDGLIINISSITARYVVDLPSKSYYVNLYPASKHAVLALTDTLRYELRHEKSRIKITSISPGITITEIFRNHTPETLKEFSSMPFMQPDDIAEAAMYILSTPPHVQVQELIIRPVGFAFEELESEPAEVTSSEEPFLPQFNNFDMDTFLECDKNSSVFQEFNAEEVFKMVLEDQSKNKLQDHELSNSDGDTDNSPSAVVTTENEITFETASRVNTPKERLFPTNQYENVTEKHIDNNTHVTISSTTNENIQSNSSENKNIMPECTLTENVPILRKSTRIRNPVINMDFNALFTTGDGLLSKWENKRVHILQFLTSENNVKGVLDYTQKHEVDETKCCQALEEHLTDLQTRKLSVQPFLLLVGDDLTAVKEILYILTT
ncbi:hypothetical protein RN001_002574 [Aquatica leii]|uniref:Dehydrogenase/reductase SDR family member 11 n=1 Tax=Aquatica leii TaxID=1421715 RepID=A0AAN7SRA2_9COLE|nr:hypothetical protein RN001_002574 [Aquatica leii]